MAITSKFYLTNPKRDISAIQLRATINSKLFKYATGQSIQTDLWDKKNQNPTKNKKLISTYRKINLDIDTDLENLAIRLSNITRDLKNELERKNRQKEKIDFKALRAFLDAEYKEVINERPEPKKLTLNRFIVQFISDIETGKRMFTGANGALKRYSTGTVNEYNRWKTQFDNFQKHKNQKFDFDDITLEWYKEYTAFFSAKSYTTNSIGKQVKNLKAIMKAALDAKHHANRDFQSKLFKTAQAATVQVYLTQYELDKLYAIDLSNKPHRDLARDVFICGCYTALRYSDYSRLSAKHIKEDENGIKTIEIITRKTGERVIIPLNPIIDKILQKYNNSLPKTYEQKVNNYIKLVAKDCKINEPIEIEKIVKGLTVKSTVPKHDLIKTHTARRTGATLMYKNKISIVDIMSITGHRKPSNLLKYIKVTKKEIADNLSENPFFTGLRPLKVAK